MRLTNEQYLDFISKSGSKVQSNPVAIDAAKGLVVETQKKSKFGNKKEVYDGHTFDSRKERRRYETLLIMQRAKLITDLKLQVPFELERAVVINGRTKKAMKYIADFTYIVMKTGKLTVEDVKSEQTKRLPAYRNKLHLLKARYGIDVVEV